MTHCNKNVYIFDSGTKKQETCSWRYYHSFSWTEFLPSFAIEPSGKYVMVGGSSRIKLWDFESNKEIGSFGPLANINNIVVHPSKKWVVIAAQNVQLWDYQKKMLLLTIQKNNVNSLSISSDGKFLAASSGRYVYVWNLASGTLLFSLPSEDREIAVVKFHPSKYWLFCGDNGSNIKVWDLENIALLYTLIGHQDQITDLTFHPSRKILASSSIDQTIRIWDLETRNLVKTIPLSEQVGLPIEKRKQANDVLSIDFHKQKEWLVAGKYNGDIYIWDSVTWEQLDKLSSFRKIDSSLHSQMLGSVIFHPIEKIIFSSNYFSGSIVSQKCQ